MSILRFATAGSVDDGKSSLIGRLLYDSKSIFEDQLDSIERASTKRGSEQVELALLTDGLRAEREQNITIDVAYRYFSTPKRKFIIADTPGHFQYTRNMVTGTSNVDLSVILIDARKGVLPQSKRHAAVSALLDVPEVVVAVNKMDLVDFSEARFNEIVTEFREVARKLGIKDLRFVPLSALLGDNVVDPSANMPWYQGPTLLNLLEDIEITSKVSLTPFRMPVQVVIRPHQDYRGLAGTVQSGSIRVGDPIVVLPSGRETTVASIRLPDGNVNQAVAGDPAVIELAEEIDVSRGDLLAAMEGLPSIANRFGAVICWLNEEDLKPGDRLTLLHGAEVVPAEVERVVQRLDIETLDPQDSIALGMNDIGEVVVRTARPIFADRFSDNHGSGSFVLVEQGTNRTVAAGMVRSFEVTALPQKRASARIVWIPGQDVKHSASLGTRLVHEAHSRGFQAVLLEDTRLGRGLNSDDPSPTESARRVFEVARLLQEQSVFVVIATELASEARESFDQVLWLGDESDLPTLEEVLFGELGGL